MAIPGAGCAGADDAKQRAGGSDCADGGDGVRVCLGEPVAGALLERRSRLLGLFGNISFMVSRLWYKNRTSPMA